MNEALCDVTRETCYCAQHERHLALIVWRVRRGVRRKATRAALAAVRRQVEVVDEDLLPLRLGPVDVHVHRVAAETTDLEALATPARRRPCTATRNKLLREAQCVLHWMMKMLG